MTIECNYLFEDTFSDDSIVTIAKYRDKELRMIVSIFPVEQIMYEVTIACDVKYKDSVLQSAIDYYNCY